MADKQTIESVDEHLINLTRFVLALSALIIIYVDPSEPDRLVNIPYTTLALYTVYSASIYFLSLKRQSAFRTIPLYWLDVAWFLVLISLSSGTIRPGSTFAAQTLAGHRASSAPSFR